MKRSKSYVAALLALAIIGCGGSGGGNSTTGTTGGTVDVNGAHIEAIVRVTRDNLIDPDPTKYTDAMLLDPTNEAVKADLVNPTVFGIQDPSNLQSNESYVFQLVRYDSSGHRIVLPATFAIDDATNVYGTLGTNTGSYDTTSLATPSTKPLTVRAYVNDVLIDSATVVVNSRQVRLLGNLVRSDNGQPVVGVHLLFVTATGLPAGSVTTAHDGTFRASVSPSATSFTVDPTSLPFGSSSDQQYYLVFGYNGANYAAGDADCRAPVSALDPGTEQLGTVTLYPRSLGMSPDLSGCSDSTGG